MLSIKKNKIAGERSRFFAVTPLRFLIYPVRHAELVSASNPSARHETLKQVQGDGRRMGLILILLVFFYGNSFSSNSAPGDSLKGKYDINDPRNPHCPCHQYQKLADEEFAKLQNKEKNKENVSVNGVTNNQNVNSGKQNSAKDNFWFFHKKKGFSGKNQKGRGQRKMKGRFSDKLSRCFHF
jgi:hypothetical protein